MVRFKRPLRIQVEGVVFEPMNFGHEWKQEGALPLACQSGDPREVNPFLDQRSNSSSLCVSAVFSFHASSAVQSLILILATAPLIFLHF